MASSYPRSMIIARASGIRCTTTTKANARLPSCGLHADKPQQFDQFHDAIRRLRALDHRPLQPYGRPLRGLAQARRRHRHRRRALGAVLALVPLVSGKALAEQLAGEAIAYVALGDALGGRPRDPLLYRDGVAGYAAMAARAACEAGLERVVDEMARIRVCLLCAEREPLDCHRCLLVGRALAERGLALGHIRADGTIEPHAATEQRLLALAGGEADLFRE